MAYFCIRINKKFVTKIEKVYAIKVCYSPKRKENKFWGIEEEEVMGSGTKLENGYKKVNMLDFLLDERCLENV